MTFWEVVLTGLVVIGRVMSRWEHKKSISEIKIYLNGDIERRIEQAREEGRQEILTKQKNKTL